VAAVLGGNPHMSKKPYKEKQLAESIKRKFSKDTPDNELVWHRDAEDRRITVLQSCLWFIQMDNKLPQRLMVGDVVEIKKESYHRLLKGNCTKDLIIEIVKL